MLSSSCLLSKMHPSFCCILIDKRWRFAGESSIHLCVPKASRLSAFQPVVEGEKTKRKLLFWGRRNDAFILEMKWRGKQHLPRNSICNKTCLRETTAERREDDTTRNRQFPGPKSLLFLSLLHLNTSSVQPPETWQFMYLTKKKATLTETFGKLPQEIKRNPQFSFAIWTKALRNPPHFQQRNQTGPLNWYPVSL